MYIPIAYWQTQDTGNAHTRGMYWASSFSGVPQSYLYEYNNVQLTRTINVVQALSPTCMDTMQFSDLVYSNVAAGAGAFFCSANDSTSSVNVPPSTGAEAWYIDVDYWNTDYPAFDLGTFYWSYVDVDGNIVNDTINFGQTKRIIAQCVPLFTRDYPVVFGRYMNWRIVSKYNGNVTPYPYNGIPVDYTIQLKRERPDGGWYYNKIYYSPTATVSGFPFATNSGSFFSEESTGSIGLTRVITAGYPPLDANANNNRNPPAHWITNVSPVAKGAYQLSSCVGTSSLWVTLNNYDRYPTGSALKVSNTELTSTSSCWTITALTSSLSTSVALSNVNVIDDYTSCFSCISGSLTASLNVEYLLVAGGGGGAGAGAPSYAGPGAGGGAGGLLSGSYTLQPNTTYNVSIGIGGIGGSGSAVTNTRGNSGASSTAFGVTAIGGGRGGAGVFTGSNGGSGGGSPSAISTLYIGGFGTSGQGKNGGDGTVGSIYYPGGGGGGAATVGTSTILNSGSAWATIGGSGGSGSQWLDGNYYAAGGAAGGADYLAVVYDRFSPGVAGFGGGGAGADAQFTSSATAGSSPGSGGGGGAVSTQNQVRPGGAGADGILVFRYPGTTQLVGGGTVSISGSYVYHRFTQSGSITT
jgi:hypothetical protein